MRKMVGVLVAAGLLAGTSLAAQGPAPTATTGAAKAWTMPRTPDGKPDLQGVWSNNSVTPLERPAQWKDKASLTDAEVEELKALVGRYVSDGGDAIFGGFIQIALDAKDKGQYKQTSYVERFTRVGPDHLIWEISPLDPSTWTEPWTFMIRLKRSEGQIYEYACHEGNYAMEGILAGARAEERAAAQASKSK